MRDMITTPPRCQAAAVRHGAMEHLPDARDVLPAAPRPRERTHGNDTLMRGAAGAIGLGTAWSVYPRGGVTLGHALLAAILPVVVAAAWRSKRARICLVLLGRWAFSTALTEVATHDSLRLGSVERDSTLAVGVAHVVLQLD